LFLHFAQKWPITVATLEGMNCPPHSKAGVVVSNPTQSMRLSCVCVVLCVGSGWSPVQGVLLTVYKLRGFSPQANYTHWATAACRWSYSQLLRIDGVVWSAQRIPTAVNLDFLDPEPLLFHSSSSSVILTRLSKSLSRLTTSQKSGSAANRTRDLWICSQKLW
jgi:hypothetical protein